MRINQINTNNLTEKIDSTSKVSTSSKKASSTNTEPTIIAFPKDSINFSDATKEVQKLTEKALEAPDVRQEKVEALRSRIASGTFNPSADRILDAIIKNDR